jgi:hypothetical protein
MKLVNMLSGDGHSSLVLAVMHDQLQVFRWVSQDELRALAQHCMQWYPEVWLHFLWCHSIETETVQY